LFLGGFFLYSQVWAGSGFTSGGRVKEEFMHLVVGILKGTTNVTYLKGTTNVTLTRKEQQM